VQIALEVPAALREEYRGNPGQHVVVRVTSEGEELRRTYSLVSAPGEQPLRIAPRVHGRGRMSHHLAEQVRSGESLDVLPPNGSFTPRAVAAGGTYVAFAAGCGITPVLSVVRALLAGGAARVLLFYGNTGTARTMCLEELLALKDRHLGQLALHFVMSREPQEVELYNGRLDAIDTAIALGADPNAPNVGLNPDATALHNAVCSGSLAAVKTLVEAGASVGARDGSHLANAIKVVLGGTTYSALRDENHSRK